MAIKPRQPRPGQWSAAANSYHHIADYKPWVVTDGPGIRASLYVAGCPFQCPGCFNARWWNYRAGQPWDLALQERIIADLAAPYIRGISLLGGEPFVNTTVLLELCAQIRAEFGHEKDIWCWTGYTWEQLCHPQETADKRALLEFLDVLVDGPFLADQASNEVAFRGSTNQRLIDVPKSLAQKQMVTWQSC